MSEVVTAVCLGGTAHRPLVDCAADLLTKSQQRFAFHVLPDSVSLPQLRRSGEYSWDALESQEQPREVESRTTPKQHASRKNSGK